MIPDLVHAIAVMLRRRRQFPIWGAGLISVAALLVAAFSTFSPLERLNDLVFDTYQTLKPREPAGAPVVVVDLDDESIRRLGQWPWPRTVLAQIIDRLTEMGAAAIALDMLLAEPDRTSPALAIAQLRRQGYAITEPSGRDTLDHDSFLAESFSRAPVIAGLALAETTATQPPAPKARFGFGGADPATYLPGYDGGVRNLPLLDDAATGIGLINFPPGRDGVVRAIPLVSRYRDALYPSLAMESLRIAQGVPSYAIRSTGAHGEQDTGAPGMIAIKNGDFVIPSTADGRLWVYYSGKPSIAVIPAYRLAAIATGDDLRSMIEGRIVMIGTSAIGLRDLVATPLASGVPGVMVHAEIVDQIFGGSFLSRPDWAVGAEIAAAVLLTLLVLAFLPWLPSAANTLVAANAIAIGVAGGWLGFAWYNLLLSPLLPAQCCLLAYGAASGMRLLVSESERRYIRTAFSHYLAPAMVQQLVDNPQSLVLGGEDRELTLLFCDIRGFTSLSEGLPPTELTAFLNDYLTPMTEVLMESGATIDKYMGDGIMAFWNAPIGIEDHRERACRSVLSMEEALAAFNRERGRNVAFGIGLNTGICCVGNLGSRQRFDYSAIGDPVNVASRIEGMTKQYGLSNLLAEETAGGATHLALIEVDRVRLVGREAATPVFTVLGDAGYREQDAFIETERLYGRFLEDYRAQRFSDALLHLDTLAPLAPPRIAKLLAIMRERVRRLQADPPPAGWDGVYTANEK